MTPSFPETKGTLAASATPLSSGLRARTWLAIPAAVVAAMVVHGFVSRQEPAPDTHSYWVFLGGLLAVSLVLSVIQRWSLGLRQWMRDTCPIVAAAVVLLTLWALITSGFR